MDINAKANVVEIVSHAITNVQLSAHIEPALKPASNHAINAMNHVTGIVLILVVGYFVMSLVHEKDATSNAINCYIVDINALVFVVNHVFVFTVMGIWHQNIIPKRDLSYLKRVDTYFMQVS